MKKLMLAVAIAVVSAASFAQGGGMFMRGGGGSPTMLLTRKDVQRDLALTDEQKDKLDKIREDAMEAMRERMQNGGGFQPGGAPPSEEEQKKMRAEMQKFQEEQEAKVNAVITADQQKRLLEIYIQINGNNAIQNKTVQKNLGLSDAQIEKIKSLQQKQQDANREIFQKVRDGDLDRSEARPLMEKNRTILKEELGKVLTDDQKAKLKTLGGDKKFEADPEEENGPGGPGGGGPGGPGGGGPGGPGGGGPGGPPGR